MKRRWSGMQVGRVVTFQPVVPSSVNLVPSSVDDSSAEVTSSSTLVMSPANSFASTDIGDVDLEFWDLDLNHQNQARNLIIQTSYGLTGHAVITTVAKSDTSSMSGMKKKTYTLEISANFHSCKIKFIVSRKFLLHIV